MKTTNEHAPVTAADVTPDPEDGTLCADCKAPRNAIHSPLCSVRAGAKPGRMLVPVTAEKLDEVDRLDREATPGPWGNMGDSVIHACTPDERAIAEICTDNEADVCIVIAARTLLPRLAAEVRAIESMLVEAGMVRREGDMTRSLLARFIADANEEAQRTEAAETDVENAMQIAAEEADAHEHDFAIVLHNTAIVRARLVLATKIQSRLADRVLELGEDLERSRLVNAQAEALMADRERLSRDLARMQLQLMQAQRAAIAEGRAAK